MTPGELERMELLWGRRATMRAIAADLGYSVATIACAARADRRRFPPRQRRADANELSGLVARVRDGEVTIEQAAAKLGVSTTTVWRRLHKED